MGEKTEKATPKKLRDAKKKGQVAKSQDLPAAFTFIASIAVILYTAQDLYHYLGDYLIGLYRLVPTIDDPSKLIILMVDSVYVIFLASIPTMAVVAIIGTIVTFLSVGPVFAPEVFKFDIKKFDPVSNLKAKFKLRTLVELLKSLFKIGVACYIIYDVMYKSLPVLVQAVSLPVSAALLIFNAFLLEVCIKVGLFFIAVAIADHIYQKKSFENEMKMEKFEVKQEYKNTEGDPLIKSKRRQIAQEIAYQEGPSGGVKRARAVVTNPTHLAIAIGYQREIDAAPFILAKGNGNLAEEIIRLAERYEVPVLRNIPLAHKLWENGEINEYVPEETYEALAQILRWLESMKPVSEYNPDMME